MLTHTMLGLTAALLTGAASGFGATPPEPEAFKSLKPHQVLEQFLARRDQLKLTDQQVARLDALHLTVLNEKHQFTHRGGKPHRTRHVRMISRREAFGRAVAVLTPEQQERIPAAFPAPARAARRATVPRGKP